MNKTEIMVEISSRIEEMEATHGFTNKTGSIQVEGLGEELNLYYGQYSGLVDLYEHITDSTWVTDRTRTIIRLH